MSGRTRLREAKDAGLDYEKLRLLSTLRDPKDVAALAGEAPTLTVVELREKVTEVREGQMRASDRFRAAVPRAVALLLSAAFESVRRVEGIQLSSASCLVRVARHFIEAWKDQVKRPRTVAQKVRARDGRCQVPGCSGPAAHSHHLVFRSHGGGNEPEQQLGGCIPHHLVGIHRGYIEASGRAPDQLTWKVGGRVWRDARFGRGPDGRLLPLTPGDEPDER